MFRPRLIWPVCVVTLPVSQSTCLYNLVYFSLQLEDFNNKLETLKRECSVLDHKLTDKEAALTLETKLRQTTSQELQKLKQNLYVLRKQQKQLVCQVQCLYDTAQDVDKTILQSLTTMNKCVNKVLSFEERVKFAAGRIHFIAGTQKLKLPVKR